MHALANGLWHHFEPGDPPSKIGRTECDNALVYPQRILHRPPTADDGGRRCRVCYPSAPKKLRRS